jgi:hypothetical protein
VLHAQQARDSVVELETAVRQSVGPAMRAALPRFRLPGDMQPRFKYSIQRLEDVGLACVVFSEQHREGARFELQFVDVCAATEEHLEQSHAGDATRITHAPS